MTVKKTKSTGNKAVTSIHEIFEALGILVYPCKVQVKPQGSITNPASPFDLPLAKDNIEVPFDHELDYKVFCAYKGFDVWRCLYITGELTKDSDPKLEKKTFSITSKITPAYLNKKYPVDCQFEWPNQGPWMEIGGKYTLKMSIGCSMGNNLCDHPTQWIIQDCHITLTNPLPPR